MKLATFYDHVKDVAHQERIGLTEALQRVKALGIDYVEVMQNNVIGREDEIGHELSFCELGISSIPAYFDFGPGADVKSQALPTLEAARYLGAKKMMVIPKERRSPEAIARCVNELAELSAGYGVSLVMEEYDDTSFPICRTEDVLYYLDACPALSCCFDTGNFRFMGEDELDAYEQLKGRIAHVHLKDRAFTPQWGSYGTTAVDGQNLYPAPVGSGEIQIKELLSRLGKDGYDGLYTIEHFGVQDMYGALRQSVEWLQKAPFEN